jgi:epoxyqueuosine reductase
LGRFDTKYHTDFLPRPSLSLGRERGGQGQGTVKMKAKVRHEDLGAWTENIVREFVQESPDNTMKTKRNEKAWADPLVGFSRGDDPLYQRFNDHIGPFHWTPHEIFTQTFPGLHVMPEELTVISWILPQTDTTKVDNRKETAYPSERWARSRIFGEELIIKLYKHVVAILQANGHEAVAPVLSPRYEWKKHETYGFGANWSERHAAYTAGLGTFGLCDGLITPRGKAMRCGSVVARIQIPHGKRPYTDHRAYCLFFSKRVCGKCIQRCPAGAITEKGHDKDKCRNYLVSVTHDYVKSHYGFEGYGCGLCQTGVPCESEIPVKP